MSIKTNIKKIIRYDEAILKGFDYLLKVYPEVFIIGQGLWSPWYVGNTMNNLEKKYGKERIIDTPVSESACTGAAVGASLKGMKPVIVHPRMDFLLYAMDSIVNHAAKWSYMFGGQASPSVTVRAIINRGGEQGPQHSQALHSWFAHVPGLTVVMPSSVQDAKDLLIASVLSKGPVIYIDDKWLYGQEAILKDSKKINLSSIKPKIINSGKDITIVGCGHSLMLAKQSNKTLLANGIKAEIIDLRIVNPFKPETIVKSVLKTRRLLVVDPGTRTAGFAAEVISSVVEKLPIKTLLAQPVRITLPDAPAPTSSNLEKNYYFNSNTIIANVFKILKKKYDKS